jgi:membrane-bound lytic murein transglycosylase D
MTLFLQKIGRPAGLGLVTLLLAALPACVTAQKIVAFPDRPVAATATVAPTLNPTTLTPPPTTIADQENDDLVVDALAKEPMVASEPSAKSGGNGPSQLLIGPLLDPLFEPQDLAAEVAESEEQTEELIAEEDPDDPLLTGELEPLSIEEIPLPGPNDFGTLEGALADTRNIGDLAEISDPDTQYDLPVVLNEQVQFFLDQYLTSHRRVFERWLARSGRFLPMIQEELAKAGLPLDLCYLPMIESGFRVTAYSPAKAMGAWQFIPGTAKMYDLIINKEIDERRDPVKSTRAAIRFLSDLYEDFQSWPLAIAAYNSGGGRVRNAVAKTGSTDFWELAKSRYLPAETKYYVPKLLAAIIVAKNPGKYGFEEIEYEAPLAFETVQVPKSTHLAAVALAAGTDLEEIYSLNRHLRRAVTPADQKYCRLCVPVGTSELISQNLPLVRTTFTTKYKTHVVKKKETAARISKKYGISKQTLLKVNHLREAKLKPGLRLQIPYQTKSYRLSNRPEQRLAADRTEQPEETSREPIRHKIRPGDTLYQLARRYKVSMEKIVSWNNLRDPRRLSVGQIIDIYLNDRNAALLKVDADTANA